MPENMADSEGVVRICPSCGKVTDIKEGISPSIEFSQCDTCLKEGVPKVLDDTLLNIWENLVKVYGITETPEQEALTSAILLLGACILRAAQIIGGK